MKFWRDWQTVRENDKKKNKNLNLFFPLQSLEKFFIENNM